MTDKPEFPEVHVDPSTGRSWIALEDFRSAYDALKAQLREAEHQIAAWNAKAIVESERAEAAEKDASVVEEVIEACANIVDNVRKLHLEEQARWDADGAKGVVWMPKLRAEDAHKIAQEIRSLDRTKLGKK